MNTIQQLMHERNATVEKINNQIKVLKVEESVAKNQHDYPQDKIRLRISRKGLERLYNNRSYTARIVDYTFMGWNEPWEYISVLLKRLPNQINNPLVYQNYRR